MQEISMKENSNQKKLFLSIGSEKNKKGKPRIRKLKWRKT